MNYENRNGSGLKFRLRGNDSDAEVAESFYPTYSDMRRLRDGDTDSDMPHLVGTSENQHNGQETDSQFT